MLCKLYHTHKSPWKNQLFLKVFTEALLEEPGVRTPVCAIEEAHSGEDGHLGLRTSSPGAMSRWVPRTRGCSGSEAVDLHWAGGNINDIYLALDH